jgi:hypothetical protein
MKAQKPAEGILLRKDWGDTKMYSVECDCGSDDHAHEIFVEADECGVTVTTYTRQKTKWWKLNRFQIIWTLLTKGYVEYEANLIMTRQQALNYATILNQSVDDVEKFRKSK